MIALRRCWHVALAAAFLTAYLTGDVGSFGTLHFAAGYVVLAALTFRLGAEFLVPAAAPLSLRRQRRRRWLGPLAASMLVVALAAAASGLPFWGALAEKLHPLLSDLAIALAGGHMMLMLVLFAA